jgi:MIP family channel proteins
MPETRGSLKPIIAEAVGTFLLVLLGVGSAAAELSLIEVGLAFSLTVLAVILSLGSVSGAHINPSVTVGFLVTGRMKAGQAAAYIAAQCVGAIAAGALLNWFFSSSHLGSTALRADVSVTQGLVLEFLLTAILVFSVFQCAVFERAGNLAALGIAATLMALILVGGPLTGASLNTARSIGPSVFSGVWADFWIYVAGPCAGGAAGALTASWFGKADA